VEFSEIYAKIRQGLRDQDYVSLEEGMKQLLGLPPLEQILSHDLEEILNCLTEVIKELFPSSAERMGAFTEKIDEILEDASEEESEESEPDDESPEITEDFYDVTKDIRIITEKYYAGFANFTPSVQDAFIKYLNIAAPLTPEIYESNFLSFLDYFTSLPAKRLEVFPDFLDCGGNILPGEMIREVSLRLFTLAENITPEQVLFASYLGSFLLQFFDIYPELTEDKISRIINLLDNAEFYFRSFATDVLKTLVQARPELLAPHFLELLKQLSTVDQKVQSPFLLSIRDLLKTRNSSILEKTAGNKEKSQQFLKIVTELMLKSDFEVSDFACEIFFDFLAFIDQDNQASFLLRVIRLWKQLPEPSPYHMMFLQNFARKTKMVKTKVMSPEEFENPENIQVLLTELEVSIETKVKAAFKNKQNYDRSN